MDFLDQLQAALGSAYAIERELGGGGMARVFLAEERRLRRKVVVKVLAPDLAAEISASRFEREIEFAARLQHPQIVPLLVVGDAGGLPFYTMPFIDGETLATRLAKGSLTYREAIDVLRDVAKALAFAHARGVVHRDIKPANILLASGSAVVTDFGIGKALTVSHRTGQSTAARATLTQMGVAIGTPAYMSPEQAAGDIDVDHRADIYAFGCVAFEMLMGTPPFTASSFSALFAAHLTQKPAAVTEKRPDVPPSLAVLVARCLEKEPDARPLRAAQLLEALDRASAELSAPRPAATVGASPSARRVTIAVLPFKDLAGDSANEHLGIGLADATITDLASVKAILVRPTSAILPYRHRTGDALQAARELAVDAVVDGSFQRAGDRLRITIQLVATNDGTPLWGTKVTTSLDDIFVVQDEVSRRIVEALSLELTRSDLQPAARTAVVQGDAYEAYLRGRLLMMTETLEETNGAIEWYRKALEVDPSFARAYAGIADAYARIAFNWVPDADWYARAEEMCNRALALDPDLAEGRYLRGRLRWTPAAGFDHAGAMREFTAALAAQPSLHAAHRWLGTLLFHISMLDESQERFERCMAIDPRERSAPMHFATLMYLRGQFADSLAMAEESGRGVSSSWDRYTVALSQIQLGLLDSAEETAAEASRRFPGEVLFYPVSALIAAKRGDRTHALQNVDLTVRNQKAFGHYHHAQYDVACVYAQLGDNDLAVQWLTDAATNGFPCGVLFARDPLLAPIHGDARFAALLASTKAECDRYASLYRELRSSVG